MAHEREVAGIRCMEVLARLPDFLDGELTRDASERIEAHLRGCTWCEQFGGAYGAMIAELRTLRPEHGTPDPDPATDDPADP